MPGGPDDEGVAPVDRSLFSSESLGQLHGKGTLARAGHAGDHDETIARDVDVDGCEVVFPRSTDTDAIGVRAHGSACRPS